MSRRREESLVHVPSSVQPIAKQTPIHIEFFGKHLSRKKSSFKFDRQVCTSVIILLFSSRPPTIFRAVWAIFIRKSINRCALRTGSHILQKCLERVQPSVAHNDRCSSITLKSSSLGIVAPLNHAFPSPILRSDAPLSRMTVGRFLGICSQGAFPAEAATRSRFSGSQIVARNHSNLPTLTLALNFTRN